MTRELRTAMGQAAVEAAKSIEYCGAGTVEFLLDESGEFFFLEMNTRLQVEHPVTELITGLDLVELQIQVAQGDPLGLCQADIELSGHAIEVRLYTEDPAQEFLPMSGPVDLWKPASGAGIRIDSGICSGQDISPYYDPMVAKVIALGPTREIARLRLIEALKETLLFGTATNSAFLIACLAKQSFIDGLATTAFIGEEFTGPELSESIPTFNDSAIAAVLEVSRDYERTQSAAVMVAPELKNWSSASPMVSRKRYLFGDSDYDLRVMPLEHNRYRVSDADNSVDIALLGIQENLAQLSVDGAKRTARFHIREPGLLYLSIDGCSATYRDLISADGDVKSAGTDGTVTAPMHGVLLEILVAPGEAVSAGQSLAVLEAMKMHYQITAEVDGTVQSIYAESGRQVAADDLLMEITVGK